MMAAVLLGTALTVSAQRKVGSFTIQPKVGMTVSSMTNNPQMGVQVLTYPDFTTFDLSVPVGVSYEYNNFVIGAMYNIGLTNVFSGNWDGEEKPSARNSVWQITIGYNIEL